MLDAPKLDGLELGKTSYEAGIGHRQRSSRQLMRLPRRYPLTLDSRGIQQAASGASRQQAPCVGCQAG